MFNTGETYIRTDFVGQQAATMWLDAGFMEQHQYFMMLIQQFILPYPEKFELKEDLMQPGKQFILPVNN